MKILLITATSIFLIICLFVTCSQTKRNKLLSDPILGVGHGAILGLDGKEIKIDFNFIEATQNFYIDHLLTKINEEKGKASESVNMIKNEIYELVDDKILANAIFIDWLLKETKPTNSAQIFLNNNILRWKYITRTRGGSIPRDPPLNYKGVGQSEIKMLTKIIGDDLPLKSTQTNKSYCAECLAAGVPVPNKMFGTEWKYAGSSYQASIIENEFISDAMQAELLIYESRIPNGVCLALPRYEIVNGMASEKSSLFGVICMGAETGKVCFFDSPIGKQFTRDDAIDFKSNWLGGSQLVSQQVTGGICTDCHAGENPFIVHPEKSAFSSIVDKLVSPRWYQPLVSSDWPQNPGPTNVLNGINSAGRKCSSCHFQGFAGRFPDISQLPMYCQSVLSKSVDSSEARTMPLGDIANINEYILQINALKDGCQAPPFVPQQ